VEIVKRSDDTKDFIVLPRHWVVERTFSWFGQNQRLAKDYGNLAELWPPSRPSPPSSLPLAACQGVARELKNHPLAIHDDQGRHIGL